MARRVTQLTHNDLDGYGASAVAAAHCAVDEVVHVMRYSDVGPVLSDHVARLAAAGPAETVLVTDLGIERDVAGLVRAFARMNAGREAPHRLVVLDHHASSIAALEGAGLVRHAERGMLGDAVAFTAPEERAARSSPLAADVLVVVGLDFSATFMADALAPLYDGGTAPGLAAGDARMIAAVRSLVACVDAVDVWRTDDPAFPAGMVMNDAFYEVVSTVAPVGHPLHEPFVRGFLLDLAAAAGTMSPGDLETSVGGRRRAILSRVFREVGYEEDHETRERLSLRSRMSRYLAQSDDLLVEGPGGIKVCHAVDVGIFQRVSDAMLRSGRARVAVDVLRGGSMSIRSRDGSSALALARVFGGGGHADAAGARLTRTDPVLTLADAIERMRVRIEEAGPGAWPPAGGRWGRDGDDA